MMGSVLSLLDPAEPILALAGDRRLYVGGGTNKPQQHLRVAVQSTWSSSSSEITANKQRNLKLRLDGKQTAGEMQEGLLAGNTTTGKQQLQSDAAAAAAKWGSRRASAVLAAAAAEAATHAQQQLAESVAGMPLAQPGKQIKQQQTDTRRRQSADKEQRILGFVCGNSNSNGSSMSGDATLPDGANSASCSSRKAADRRQQQKIAQTGQRATVQKNDNNNNNSNDQSTIGHNEEKAMGKQTTTTTMNTQTAIKTIVVSKPRVLTCSHVALATDGQCKRTCSSLNRTTSQNFNNQPQIILPKISTTQVDKKNNNPNKTINPQKSHMKESLNSSTTTTGSSRNNTNPREKLVMGPTLNQSMNLRSSRRQKAKFNNKTNQQQKYANNRQLDDANIKQQSCSGNNIFNTNNGKNNRKRGANGMQQQPHQVKVFNFKENNDSNKMQSNGGHSQETVYQNNTPQSNNNSNKNHHLQQYRQRDHRSLSTSSSLASSGSSSPSSSMLHIFSQKELQRQRQRRNQQQQQQQQKQQQLLLHNSRPPSSSASSTVSSLCSSEASKQIILCGSPASQQQEVRVCSSIDVPVCKGPVLWPPANQQQAQLLAAPNELECQPSPLLPQASPSYAFTFPAPPPRPWLFNNNAHNINERTFNKLMIQQQQANEPTGNLFKLSREPEFTVISYNVLCDRMVSKGMFPSSPEIALDWQYRRELILRQLLEFNADIIALQELEFQHFEEFFKLELGHLGNYESIFEPKSRARYMDNQKRRRVDGCAIFYKRNRFKLLQRHLLEFNQIAMANAQGSEAMLNRVMTKDNIGLAAVLEFIQDDDDDDEVFTTIDSSSAIVNSSQFEPIGRNHHLHPISGKPQRILVCNTHIHWDPECCDVKLVQTIMLMNELECLARHYANCGPALPANAPQIINHLHLDPSSIAKDGSIAGGGDHLLPLVLVGDFNSMPNSGVTTYLTDGKINSLHDDFMSFKYTSCSNALALHQRHHWSQTSNDGNNNNNNITNNNNNDKNNNNNNTQTGSSAFRRQSSPAWCFYTSAAAAAATTTTNTPPSTCPSSASSSYSSPSPISSASSSSSSSSSNHHSSPPTKGSDEQQQMKQILNYDHPFKLVSAYDKDTMPYTNYTDKFKAIIDYIFYSRDSIQLMGLLGPLDKNWLKGNRIRGLPQPHLPSDHLPLLVKLKLTSSNTTTTTTTTSDQLTTRGPILSSSAIPPNSINSPVVKQPQHSYYNQKQNHHQNGHHQKHKQHQKHHQQQQQVTATMHHYDYSPTLDGGDGNCIRNKRQQLNSKLQSFRVNSKNRIKYEQIRS